MSRSCYAEEYGDEYPGQRELFRANVRRSMRGKKGQARLRELRDALLALPIKELVQETFVDPASDSGKLEVCALGAWAVKHHEGNLEAAAALATRDADDNELADKLQAKGWPKLVVLDTIYENDREHYEYVTGEGPHESPYAYYNWHPVTYQREETPAERYVRVLAWVEEQLQS